MRSLVNQVTRTFIPAVTVIAVVGATTSCSTEDDQVVQQGSPTGATSISASASKTVLESANPTTALPETQTEAAYPTTSQTPAATLELTCTNALEFEEHQTSNIKVAITDNTVRLYGFEGLSSETTVTATLWGGPELDDNAHFFLSHDSAGAKAAWSSSADAATFFPLAAQAEQDSITAFLPEEEAGALGDGAASISVASPEKFTMVLCGQATVRNAMGATQLYESAARAAGLATTAS